MKNTLPACFASRVYRAIVLLAALLSFMTTPALAETGGSDFERIMLSSSITFFTATWKLWTTISVIKDQQWPARMCAL
jgi:hypothetical protein